MDIKAYFIIITSPYRLLSITRTMKKNLTNSRPGIQCNKFFLYFEAFKENFCKPISSIFSYKDEVRGDKLLTIFKLSSRLMWFKMFLWFSWIDSPSGSLLSDCLRLMQLLVNHFQEHCGTLHCAAVLLLQSHFSFIRSHNFTVFNGELFFKCYC